MSGWAAAAGAAMELGNTAFQALSGKWSQKRSQTFAKRMYKRRYQYTVQDLRKAGINPIYMMGTGAGSAPQGGGFGAKPGGNPAEAGARVATAAQNLELLKETTAKTKAETSVAASTAMLRAAEAEAVRRYGLGGKAYPGLESLGKGGSALLRSLMRAWDEGRGKRGKTYKYKIPPDTGRSGYEQRMPRLQ